MGGNIGKIVIVVLGLQLPASGPQPPTAPLSHTGSTVEQLRGELAECRAECERLREENARLRDGSGERGAELLREFVVWFAREISDPDPVYAARLMEGLEIGLDEWSKGDERRRAFASPARRTLKRFIRTHLEAGRSSEQTGNGDRSRALPEIERSPARLRVELAETDRAKVATAVAGYAGREVVWRGRVTGWDGRTPELVCDGVIVKAAVVSGGKGLKINEAAAVRGVIADIAGNAWVGVEVRLRQGAVLPDPGGAAEPLRSGG